MSNSFDKSSTSLTLDDLIDLVSKLKDNVSDARKEIDILKEGRDRRGDGSDGGEGGDESQRKDTDDGLVRYKKPDAQSGKLQNNLEQIKTSLEALKHYEEDFGNKIKAHSVRIGDLIESIRKLPVGTKATDTIGTKATDTIGKKLWEINKEITKLKHRIPSSSKFSGPGASHHDESQKTEGSATEVAVDGLLSLYSSKSFPGSSFYDEIKGIYGDLSEERKYCLLCFAVFSENQELKKRMLTYWWEGEEFLERPSPGEEKTIEELAGEILDDFVEKGLIKPVYKRRRPTARSYRMEPVVQSIIVMVAAEVSFFSYDEGGNLTGKPPVSGCERACLVKSNKKPEPEKVPSRSNSQEKETQNSPATSSSNPQQDQANLMMKSKKESSTSQGPENFISRSNSQGQETQNAQMSPSTSLSNPQLDEANSKTRSNKESSASSGPEKLPSRSNSQNAHLQQEANLVTIFNVDEPFPDLRLRWFAREKGGEKDKSLEAEDWLSKMKALKVLSLGTWRASSRHHIEVDRTEFLKGLTRMSSLRLLSLQGISRINELTESIKGLINLRILDLKACHNLEELPKEMSYLENLTHLDISDCYMIDHLPRGLSYLTNLQVLKGFVVADHKNRSGRFCTFDHLVGMKKLRKLSIIVSKKNFPAETDLKTFENLEGLKNLSLLWGADSTITDVETARSSTVSHDHDRPIKSFENLEKLCLQCYPEESPPNWLRPRELDGLKKLYIRGGKLGGDLRYFSNESVIQYWQSVETLRLKYLAGLKMNWEEMKELFPKLSYLEKVDCPLITMCPCDEDGVWVKYDQEEKQSDHEQEPADQKAQKQSEIRSEQRSGASAI